MCYSCLVVKSCCFGADLSHGTIFWAVVDILFHLLLLGLPSLLADIAPFATYFVSWIVVLIVADVILILGTKTCRPALLFVWLVVFLLNIILLFLLWALVIAGAICFSARDVNCSWNPFDKSPDEILSYDYWLFSCILALILLVLVPPLHIYFWLVVHSLRRRMWMEIAIGFNAQRQEIVMERKTPWDKVYPELYNNRQHN